MVYNPAMEWFVGMWPLWTLLILVAALVALLRMYAGRGKLPYDKRPRLVTKAELRFYKSLIKAVQDDWTVFAMVRIADILVVPKTLQSAAPGSIRFWPSILILCFATRHLWSLRWPSSWTTALIKGKIGKNGTSL